MTDIGFIDADGFVRLSINSTEPLDRDYSHTDYFLNLSSLDGVEPPPEFIYLSGGGGEERDIVMARPIITDEDKFGGLIFFVLRLQELIAGHVSHTNNTTRT